MHNPVSICIAYEKVQGTHHRAGVSGVDRHRRDSMTNDSRWYSRQKVRNNAEHDGQLYTVSSVCWAESLGEKGDRRGKEFIGKLSCCWIAGQKLHATSGPAQRRAASRKESLILYES